MILTPRGEIAAKDLRAGDTVLSIAINEIGNNSVTPIEFTVGATLTSTSQLVETKIVGILETVKTGITYFNGRSEARYSSQQPLFVKSDGEFQVKIVSNIKLGDALLLINPDGTYTEEEVTEITLVSEPANVFQFSCEPYHWFIAGGYLAHNK